MGCPPLVRSMHASEKVSGVCPYSVRHCKRSREVFWQLRLICWFAVQVLCRAWLTVCPESAAGR